MISYFKVFEAEKIYYATELNLKGLDSKVGIGGYLAFLFYYFNS